MRILLTFLSLKLHKFYFIYERYMTKIVKLNCAKLSTSSGIAGQVPPPCYFSFPFHSTFYQEVASYTHNTWKIHASLSPVYLLGQVYILLQLCVLDWVGRLLVVSLSSFWNRFDYESLPQLNGKGNLSNTKRLLNMLNWNTHKHICTYISSLQGRMRRRTMNRGRF